MSAWMISAARRGLIVRDGLRAVAEWRPSIVPLTDAELAAGRRRVAQERVGEIPPRPPGTAFTLGVFVAAERHDRAVWAEHRACL